MLFTASIMQHYQIVTNEVFFPTISRPTFPSNMTLKIFNVLLSTTEARQAVPLPFVSALSAFPNYYCYLWDISYERLQVLSSPSRHLCTMIVLHEQVLPWCVVCVRHGTVVVFSPCGKNETNKKKNTSNAKVWFCGNVRELVWESLLVNFATPAQYRSKPQEIQKSKSKTATLYMI